SHFSDGALTPEELIGSAQTAGIGVLALTDHDTIAGLERAQTAASRLQVALVAGVEISTSWRAQSIHILGLWIDPACRTLVARLEGLAQLRRERLRAMCLKLAKLRLPGERLKALVEAQGSILTRTHLAQALVAEGCVDRADEAFRKYLAKGKPAH